MTDRKIPVTEDELHAYIDNELPAERRGDVEGWLEAHPDEAARVQSWRALADALHARYGAILLDDGSSVLVVAGDDSAHRSLFHRLLR